MLTNKLYECHVGGATYWVAALHEDHARECLYAECEQSGADSEDVDDAKIAECPQDRAERLRFASGDDEHRSMFGEFQRGSYWPRIIACSEWP